MKVKPIKNPGAWNEDEIVERQAAFCSIFASPVRLRILWSLGEGEKNVGEMAENLGVPLPNLSQHLRLMRDLGAVRTHKVGRAVYYSLANSKFLKGSRQIREGLMEEWRKAVPSPGA